MKHSLFPSFLGYYFFRFLFFFDINDICKVLREIPNYESLGHSPNSTDYVFIQKFHLTVLILCVTFVFFFAF